MGKKLKITLIVLIVLVIASGIYLTSYYHAESPATDYLNGTANVNVEKTSSGLFVDGYGNDTLMIFYPGAKVEYSSYLPMFVELADRGVDCYLVEMPFNLAFFGSDSADAIIENTSYENYFLSGHSLGGAMAAQYTSHSNKTDGLILLASYSQESINVPTLSIYGSNDSVLNMEKYNESKPLFKSNFTEFIINGGNHAQFGYYGNQSDDGQANISAENQQKQCVDEIIKFIEYYT